MTLFQIVLVAIIQGVTEFLPISSSGHLILLPGLTGLDDQGQIIDVAVHVGTLGAVILYFREEVGKALSGLPDLLRGRIDSPESYLAFCLVIATIPVILLGLLMHLTGLDDALRSVRVIGWTMLIFGLVLYWADRTGAESRSARQWTLRDALIMGLWQALALIPGTSRSGATITGARALGYQRSEAARLAMLMSIPTIAASGLLLGIGQVGVANSAVMRDAAIAAGLAFGAALLVLWGMMRLLQRFSFTPYVIYRVMLGIGLLVYGYS